MGADVVLHVHAQPGASRSRIAGLHGGAVKIQVRARPVEGAANRELVEVVARALAVPPGRVTIEAGSHGRRKRLRVTGLDPATAIARMAPFVDKAEGAD